MQVRKNNIDWYSERQTELILNMGNLSSVSASNYEIQSSLNDFKWFLVHFCPDHSLILKRHLSYYRKMHWSLSTEYFFQKNPVLYGFLSTAITAVAEA